MPPITWPFVPQIPGAAAGTQVGSTFLGKGLLSPLREDPVTGGFQKVSDEDNVAQCLRDGILTNTGERIMSEALGTICRDMLFEQSDVVSDLVPPSVRDFIEQWEPRVIFVLCSAVPVNSTDEFVQFEITIKYRIRATNSVKNLVFPFYLTSSEI
jgi:phage baseplate assembly protein W